MQHAKRPSRSPKKVPLQILLPVEDARAIKRAAMEADQSNSDFLLDCFRKARRSRGNLALRIHNRFARHGIGDLDLVPDELPPPPDEALS